MYRETTRVLYALVSTNEQTNDRTSGAERSRAGEQQDKQTSAQN